MGQTERVADIRRFVIQQHDATRLHWDLRIEDDGVLRSWALPRGVPWNPKENRLAVHTEDHSIDFLDHVGDDFDGEFGTGRSTQWDTGVCEVHKMEEHKVVVSLHGNRVSGKYSLFSMRKTRDWLIHRMDPPADEHRLPVPVGVIPMAPTPGDVPDDAGWVYEHTLSGIRAIVTDDTGRVVITDGDGADISIHFPEVRRIGRAIGHREVILDGVIVPIRPDGSLRHDGDGLDRRMKIRSDSGARNALLTAPVVFVAFDILWVEGHPITSLPWELRRRQLDDLRLDGPGWRASDVFTLDEALDRTKDSGNPALVAKRSTSTYEIGTVSSDWISASL